MTMIIGIDPHKSTHTAVAIDTDEQPLARLQVAADRCQTARLLAWAAPLGEERTWAIESRVGWASSSPSSSSPLASTSSTCLRRCRLGFACWARRRRERTTGTTRWPRPLLGYATADCGPCRSRTTPR